MKPILVGLGEVLWDLFPTSKQLGGAPANFAFRAHSLGADGVVASCIGDDDFGRELEEQLSALGLSREYLFKDPMHQTGTVCVDVDESGRPTYKIFERVAWDFIPSHPRLMSLAARADAVCFGSLAQRAPVSRSTIGAFLEHVRPECLRLFDVNLRPPFYTRDIIDASLSLANVVKVNDEELQVVAGLLSIAGDESTILEELAHRYPLRLIALTKGSQGSVLFAPGEKTSLHPGFAVGVVDSVGAGDSFAASLVLGVLKGYDLGRINECANRIASYVCTQEGATAALPESLDCSGGHHNAG